MSTGDIWSRLEALDTASICDADKQGDQTVRIMDSGLRPLASGLKMLGRARTVSCRDDFLTVIKALHEAEAGEVLVIDARGSRRAVSGGLFPTEAKRKRLKGIVVDGPCRDTRHISNLAFPYYARSVCCYAGTSNRLFETQVPVQCGGIMVNPGDILFGDDDGVIVGSEDEMIGLVEKAEVILQTERIMISNMRKGVSLTDMMNFEEHCRRVETGKDSFLQFTIEGCD